MTHENFERLVYLHCDGLATPEEKAAVEEHLRSCQQCVETYGHARRTLEMLREGKHDFKPIADDRVNDIINRSIQESQRIGFFGPRQRKFHVSWAAAAALIIGFIGGAAFHFTSARHTDTRHIGSPVCIKHADEGDTISSKDTPYLWIMDKNTRMLSEKKTRIIVYEHSPEKADMFLCEGNAYFAVNKSDYDSFIVRTAACIVMTTGTHFTVSSDGRNTTVSVIEGAVKILQNDFHEISVIKSGKTGCFKKGSPPLHYDLSERKKADLINVFSGIEAMSKQYELEQACTSSAPPERSPKSCQDTQQQVPASKPADIVYGTLAEQHEKTRATVSPNGSDFNAAGTMKEQAFDIDASFETVHECMRRNDYGSAVIILQKMLSSGSADRDMIYNDMAQCYIALEQFVNAKDAYRSVIALSANRRLVESACHRINWIDFTKLKNYQESAKGIQTYLENYPDGEWREDEVYYLIQIHMFNHRYVECAALIGSFFKEFRFSSKTRELTYDLATIERVYLGNYTKAAKHYESYIRDFHGQPDLEQAYKWIVDCQRKIGNNKAVEVYMKAYRLAFPNGTLINEP